MINSLRSLRLCVKKSCNPVTQTRGTALPSPPLTLSPAVFTLRSDGTRRKPDHRDRGRDSIAHAEPRVDAFFHPAGGLRVRGFKNDRAGEPAPGRGPGGEGAGEKAGA